MMAGIVTRTRKRPKQIPYHGEQRTERAAQKRKNTKYDSKKEQNDDNDDEVQVDLLVS